MEEADTIYEATIRSLGVAIDGHECPNGRRSLRAFCESYGFGRPNLNQLLLGTRGHDMSLGLFLRIIYHLNPAKATCPPPGDNDPRMAISLRHCLSVDFTGMYKAISLLQVSA